MQEAENMKQRPTIPVPDELAGRKLAAVPTDFLLRVIKYVTRVPAPLEDSLPIVQEAEGLLAIASQKQNPTA